jgi:hypothetical protein
VLASGSCGSASVSGRLFQYQPAASKWDELGQAVGQSPHPFGEYMFRRATSYAAATGPTPGSSSAADAEETFALFAAPQLMTPSTWDGVTLPDTTTTSGRRRLMMSTASDALSSSVSSEDVVSPAGLTGVDTVECTEGNGGHEGTDFRGSVPAAGVRCGGGGSGSGGGGGGVSASGGGNGDDGGFDETNSAAAAAGGGVTGATAGAAGAGAGVRQWRGLPLCWSADCCHGFAAQTSWARWQCVPAETAASIPS